MLIPLPLEPCLIVAGNFVDCSEHIRAPSHKCHNFQSNNNNNNKITTWLMEPGGSMSHSQGLYNNSYPEPNQPNSPH